MRKAQRSNGVQALLADTKQLIALGTAGTPLIVGTSLTARPEQRCIISLPPFIWLLATATVAQLAGLLVTTLRRLPWSWAQGEAA